MAKWRIRRESIYVDTVEVDTGDDDLTEDDVLDRVENGEYESIEDPVLSHYTDSENWDIFRVRTDAERQAERAASRARMNASVAVAAQDINDSLFRTINLGVVVPTVATPATPVDDTIEDVSFDE